VPDFSERVLILTRALEDAGIPHAVGGAIALAYYAEPRATKDIDVNIFLSEAEGESVLRVLLSLGARFDLGQMVARVRNEGQVRLPWDPSPEIDLFFSTVPFHESCQRRARRVPFDGGEITVLSGEDLTVCKAFFNRPKDWPDIRQMLLMQGSALDIEYIRHWLREILGPDNDELRTFDEIVADPLGRSADQR
jgi:Nucleotidyltransferase of unknown function (DUF6036)